MTGKWAIVKEMEIKIGMSGTILLYLIPILVRERTVRIKGRSDLSQMVYFAAAQRPEASSQECQT